MMISPTTFIEEYKEKSYGELILIRNELIDDILRYEESLKSGIYDISVVHPSPDVVYQMNQEYLIEVLRLMNETYNESITIIDNAIEEEQIDYIVNVLYTKQTYVPDEMVSKAISLLNKLIKKGNATAINLKGALYYEGKYYKQDYKKAVSLYKKAAELGNAIAMCNLGYAYFYGNGTKINYAQAYKYFTMAEQRGEWDSFNKLGDMYRDGIYVSKDEKMAYSIYMHCYTVVPHDASNDAYPGVLRRLAECLYEGIDIPRDYDRARVFLEEALAIYERQIEDGNYYASLSIDKVKNDLEAIKNISQNKT